MEIVEHLRRQRRPLRAFVINENGQLHPEPTDLLLLIQRVNQKDPAAGVKFPEYLVQFTRENHDLKDPASPPIVKIMSKRDLYLGDKAKKEKSFNARVVEKEVQMRWVISEVDFERKMEQIRKELEKGHRVNIALTVRGGARIRPPTRQAKQETVERIAETLRESGKQNQPPEIDGRMTVLHYWPLPSGPGAANNKMADTVHDGQEDNGTEAAPQL
jgi:translation initiation factor IF-3